LTKLNRTQVIYTWPFILILLRIVFTETNGYSNEYQTVVIKLLLNRNIQNIKRK